MNNRPQYWLIRYLKFYKRDISIVIISLACVSLSLLLIGGVIKYLIDEGLNNNSSNIINQTIIILCLIIIIFGISSFFRSYFINNIAEKIINKMRIDVYANLLQKEIYYFEELKIGDTISRLTADLEHIAKLITNFLSFFLRNSIMLIGAIILMFFQTYKLTLIVLIVIPLLLIPFIRFGKYVRNLAKNALIQQGEIVSNIEETFLNVRTIYTFNQQNNKILEFEKKIQSYLNQSSSRLKYRSFFFALAISIILTSIIFVIWLGSIDIINGKMTSGQMISFIYYSVIAGMSGGGIAELLSDIPTPLAALKRVFELLGSDTFLPDPDSLKFVKTNSLLDNRINKTVEPSIKLANVNFFYPSQNGIKIINDVSFQINNSSFIGIVGRSGAGKSTIINMLLKFYLPNQGQIEINGHNILNIESKQLRSLIAYIPQEPSMFSGSIKSNIAFSKPEVAEEEINEIAALLGITDFAKDFKNGLQTEIGQRGIKLSGGQKQRIAIARALIYKPQILLLDEATSNLDRESEQKVLSIIREQMRGKIIISISHRISCLEQADEILVIDKGNLTAKGTHKELLKKSNIYKILYDEQLISK